jgi:hypothetical protein
MELRIVRKPHHNRKIVIGFCAEKRVDLPGNYFVPFV